MLAVDLLFRIGAKHELLLLNQCIPTGPALAVLGGNNNNDNSARAMQAQRKNSIA